MDLATLIGLVLSFGLVIGGIVTGSSILLFVDIPSMLIVGGGTLGATLVQHPLGNVLGTIAVMKNTFFSHLDSPPEVITRFMDYANRARREGILSLEPLIKEIDDYFLKKGCSSRWTAWSRPPSRRSWRPRSPTWSSATESGAEIMATFATFAPAMGMIGTVIGLIQMLQNMSDPASIGPAMAVALITTFYGAVAANLIFLPMTGKLKARSKEEVLIKEMILGGILSISKGENPRIIEEKAQLLPAAQDPAPGG
jgi:chemotaxis protein MotA